MSIYAQSHTTCLDPYLSHACINCTLSTGSNEAGKASAFFSSSGKHPKRLKHHFNGCK